MYDRVFFPLVWLVVERQPLEQLPLPLEDGLQCREQQRLAKTARTGQEIHSHGGPDQLPDVLSLVHIEEISLDQFLE